MKSNRGSMDQILPPLTDQKNEIILV